MSFWAEALGKWEMSRQGAAGEVLALGSENLDRPLGEGARTARQIAQHLLEAGAAFTAAFEQGVSWVDPPKLPQDGVSAQDLSRALLDQWAELKPRLEKLAAAEAEVKPGFFGPSSNLTNLWFAVAHEWYHQGQLAMHVRACGRVPALTQRLEQLAREQASAPAR